MLLVTALIPNPYTSQTIITYQAQQQGNGCPQLTPATFASLKLIVRSLQEFKKVSLLFSRDDSTIHLVLSSYVEMMRSLTVAAEDADSDAAHPTRRKPYELAIAKLQKYLKLAVANNWVCAAFGEFARLHIHK